MEIISSLDNKKVKSWTKLNQKKYRDEENKFLVEGEHLVKEALDSGYLEEVIKTEDCNVDIDLNTTYVTYEVLKKISNTMSPQKIMGICKKKNNTEIKNNVLILDDVQDPGNFGTIIRSCVAFNIETIIVSPNTVDEYNDKTIRASEGMIFNINIIRKDLNTAIDELKEQNYQVYGTKVTNGENIKNIEINNKIALIMGNEGAGVKKELLDKCDKFIYINMNQKCESLNVGVATSILLYEINNKMGD